MPKNRILIVSAEYPPETGGIATYVYQVARGLHERGWMVHVIAYRQFVSDEALRAYDASQPFPITVMNNRSDRKTISHVIREWHPDLIISSDLPPTWATWWMAIIRRIPYVPIGYGSEFRQSRFPRSMIKQVVYNLASYNVVISQYTLQRMRAIGIRNKNIALIYPAGDETLLPDVDSAFLRERYNLHGKRVLFTMGTLSERKGQQMVIRALPQIIAQYPDVHYVMAGRDRSEGRFLQLAQELGVADYVTYAGVIPEAEKAAHFNLAEFCLIPSQNEVLAGDVEGYGIVVIEAGHCRRTSIGTRENGIEEAIQDEVTGLLVAQDSVDEIVSACLKLLNDDHLRQTLADEAYDYARNHATWGHRVDEFDALIRKILE